MHLAHFLLPPRSIYQSVRRDMQRVFITGIAGFLGAHLARKMFDEGWIVAGNDNFIGADKSNVHDFVDFFHIDCCDLTEMQKAIDDSDLVFH